MARKIYIAMNGSIGCLPDNSEAFTSKKSALEYVKDLFDIKGTRKAGELNRNMYVNLGPEYGADYAEISEEYGDMEDFTDNY